VSQGHKLESIILGAIAKFNLAEKYFLATKIKKIKE